MRKKSATAARKKKTCFRVFFFFFLRKILGRDLASKADDVIQGLSLGVEGILDMMGGVTSRRGGGF